MPRASRLRPGTGRANTPGVVVYAYGRDGRKVLLLFVDEQHGDVGREIAVLTAAWQELRGANWLPDPEAAVLIRRLRARGQALRVGPRTAGGRPGDDDSGAEVEVGEVPSSEPVSDQAAGFRDALWTVGQRPGDQLVLTASV